MSLMWIEYFQDYWCKHRYRRLCLSYDTLNITNVTTSIITVKGTVWTPPQETPILSYDPLTTGHQCHYQDPYFQDFRVNTPARDSVFWVTTPWLPSMSPALILSRLLCEHPLETPFSSYDPLTTTNIIDPYFKIISVNTPLETGFTGLWPHNYY